MNPFAPRNWHPEEKPLFAGSPSFPRNRPSWLRVAYLLVGTLVTITGGLGNALVTANLVNLQGTLGAYATETNWLPAAYVMTNASMNLLLVKFRQQFGLCLFTEMFLVLYALVTFAHLFVNDLNSAIAVRAAHGMVGAALSSLGLFYTIQAYPKRETRLRGAALSFSATQLPLPLAYLFSSELLEFNEWRGLYIFELGLSLFALACVLALKLPLGDRINAFRRMDFVTFALFAPGVALLCAAITFGRVLWWFDVPWIGAALAGSVVLIVAAIFVEHSRKHPLLNLRWLSNGNIIRLWLGMFLLRVVLSEQTVGAVGFLRAVGLNNDEMLGLFTVVALATVAAMLVVALTTDRNHLLAPQVIGLLIIALGAFIDAQATSQTRPEQLYFSQGMLAFGGTLCLGPLVVSLLGQVIANPVNLISFATLLNISQNLGGLIGTSLLGTFQVVREKFHSAQLADHLTALDPQVAGRIQAGAAGFGRVLTDPAARQGQGLSSLAAAATREANILAYNDVFLLIAVVAAVFALSVFLNALWSRYSVPAAPAPALPAPSPSEQITD